MQTPCCLFGLLAIGAGAIRRPLDSRMARRGRGEAPDGVAGAWLRAPGGIVAPVDDAYTFVKGHRLSRLRGEVHDMLLTVIAEHTMMACPLCGDGASTDGAGSALTWILVAGLGAVVLVRSLLRKQDAAVRDAEDRKP